jgi:type IV pilus assembly protein PilF
MITCLTACVPMQDKPSESQTASDINVQLGLAYLNQCDTARAKEKLLLALQEAPNSITSLDAMGYFLEKTGDSHGAEKYYQHAIKIAPNNGAVLNNYGTFLCRQRKPKEAIMLFLKAVQDKYYVNSAEAYENAGLCALTIPNQAQTKQFFVKALQQDPKRVLSKLELEKLNA